MLVPGVRETGEAARRRMGAKGLRGGSAAARGNAPPCTEGRRLHSRVAAALASAGEPGGEEVAKNSQEATPRDVTSPLGGEALRSSEEAPATLPPAALLRFRVPAWLP